MELLLLGTATLLSYNILDKDKKKVSENIIDVKNKPGTLIDKKLNSNDNIINPRRAHISRPTHSLNFGTEKKRNQKTGILLPKNIVVKNPHDVSSKLDKQKGLEFGENFTARKSKKKHVTPLPNSEKYRYNGVSIDLSKLKTGDSLESTGNNSIRVRKHGSDKLINDYRPELKENKNKIKTQFKSHRGIEYSKPNIDPTETRNKKKSKTTPVRNRVDNYQRLFGNIVNRETNEYNYKPDIKPMDTRYTKNNHETYDDRYHRESIHNKPTRNFVGNGYNPRDKIKLQTNNDYRDVVNNNFSSSKQGLVRNKTLEKENNESIQNRSTRGLTGFNRNRVPVNVSEGRESNVIEPKRSAFIERMFKGGKYGESSKFLL